MKQSHHITIRAPFFKVFAAASDVARWPEFLPHYRFNRFLTHKASGGIVKMSCLRSGVVATWVADYFIDPRARQLHFRHLKSSLNATTGMVVQWDFEELPDGFTQISIHLDLPRHTLSVAPVTTDWVVEKYFIEFVATQTLAGMKRKLEAPTPAALLLATGHS